MAKIVNLDELLEMAHALELEVSKEIAILEATATLVAAKLGKKLKCNYDAATWEGQAYAGLCASFTPLKPKQPLPKIFKEMQIDNGGDWE